MDELKYKPIGYSYRVDDNVWAGEFPKGVGIRCANTSTGTLYKFWYKLFP